MTFHYSTAEKRLLMIGSADSPSQTNRMIQLAPTSFIALARLSAITLSQQAQSAGKSHRLASQKDSQSIRLASFCLRVSQLTARNTERGLAGRSEERRVGKECRWRWSVCESKKKTKL